MVKKVAYFPRGKCKDSQMLQGLCATFGGKVILQVSTAGI